MHVAMHVLVDPSLSSCRRTYIHTYMQTAKQVRLHSYLCGNLQVWQHVCMSSSSYVLAVAMQKGGVGKTTTANNVAYELHLAGLSVLLIDLDPQANATDGYGVELGDDDGTMYEVLVPDRGLRMPLEEVIKRTENGVDIAPSSDSLYALERTGLGPGGENRLKVAIDALPVPYDAIVIDCPPALGPMTTSAFAAATDVLAVVSPGGPDELKGLTALANNVYDAQELLNPQVDIRHVLLANYNGGSALAKGIRLNLERDWPNEYLGEISRTVRVGEAKDKRLPIAVWSPSCTAALDYRAVAKKLLKRLDNARSA